MPVGCILILTVPVGLSKIPMRPCSRHVYSCLIKPCCISYGSKGNSNVSGTSTGMLHLFVSVSEIKHIYHLMLICDIIHKLEGCYMCNIYDRLSYIYCKIKRQLPSFNSEKVITQFTGQPYGTWLYLSVMCYSRLNHLVKKYMFDLMYLQTNLFLNIFPAFIVDFVGFRQIKRFLSDWPI